MQMRRGARDRDLPHAAEVRDSAGAAQLLGTLMLDTQMLDTAAVLRRVRAL